MPGMRMAEYQNLSGNSGVAAYALASDSIIVKFVDGGTYVYTRESAGRENIELMKTLARTGKGLSTFIATRVSDRYAAKLS
jgi:hypothetical protein